MIKNNKLISLVFLLAEAFVLTSAFTVLSWPAQAEITVQFSPRGGVADTIEERLTSARKTVDVAMYSFSDRRLQEKLIGLAAAGVKIRLILDSARDRAPLADRFEASGIDVRYVLPVMHHKFAVIDFAGEGAAPILLTGSANWSTKSDTEYDEDFLVVENESDILRAFQAEFDHLWLYARDFEGPAIADDRTPTPPAQSTKHLFTSANFEAYHRAGNWSFRPMVEPQDGVAGRAIVEAIEGASTSIKIATTHFRRPDITAALIRAMNERGVKVTVITDQQEFRGGRIPEDDSNALYEEEKLAREGASVLYKTYMINWRAPQARQMHSKYVIVDDALVLSGSFNWSKNSEIGSFENLSIWTEASLVAAYVANFEIIRTYDGDGGLATLLAEIAGQEGRGPCLFTPISLTIAQLEDLRRAFRPGSCR